MALLTGRGSTSGPSTVTLATSLGGNVEATNRLDRGGWNGRPALLTILTVGAGSCNYTIEASADNSYWFAAPYATLLAPTTPLFVNLVVNTETTTPRVLTADIPWRFLRVTMSTNSIGASTIKAFVY